MENWRPISGLDGYEISDHGNVRNWWQRPGRGKRAFRATPVLLKGRLTGAYRRICFSVNNHKCDRFVHHMVLEAFVGPRPEGKWGLHSDGNTANNRLPNLYWGTPKENAEDRQRHGHGPQGEANPNAKLTIEQVKDIRLRYVPGKVRQVDLAQEHGISQAHVSQIIREESWT